MLNVSAGKIRDTVQKTHFRQLIVRNEEVFELKQETLVGNRPGWTVVTGLTVLIWSPSMFSSPVPGGSGTLIFLELLNENIYTINTGTLRELSTCYTVNVSKETLDKEEDGRGKRPTMPTC